MTHPVRIQILDDDFDAQSEDSLLRTLQLYGVERGLPAYGFARFCWNASCKQCVLLFECDGVRKRDLACQTDVRPGLRVKSLPAVLMWARRLVKRSA